MWWRAASLLSHHGILAVFFARFVPPIRAFVPITAGALGMPPQRFFPVNLAAILLWAPLHVVPGALAAWALRRWGIAEWHHPMLILGCARRGRGGRPGPSGSICGRRCRRWPMPANRAERYVPVLTLPTELRTYGALSAAWAITAPGITLSPPARYSARAA